MNRYVAFLRAINVGGHVVKMDYLRKLFEEMGLSNVTTFIASGNVIFDAKEKNAASLEKKIGAVLKKALGYEVAVIIRTATEVAEIAGYKAYKESELKEGSLFVGLLQSPCDARKRKIVEAMRTKVDNLNVNNREVYWHARKNFRDAEFSPAKMEKALAIAATFRNVTTIRKIAAILAKP